MALVQPKQGFASLERSLWEDYSLARHMGLSDLGTYNPSSTLPSGGKSDHAYYPARAFDVGFSPPIGEAHPVARAFFEAMIGRPEVSYVILGGTIWSRERGRHAYTAGGHEGHVHVSGTGGSTVATSPAGSSRAGPVSAIFTAAQLANLWVASGGAPRAAQMAAAVAMRESGGNPQAHALSKIEDSRGLWQINVRAHPIYRLRNLYDPRENVAAAIAISSNGSNWSPWTTAAAARADVAAGKIPEVTRPGGGGIGIPGLGAAEDVAGAIGGKASEVLGGVLGLPGQVFKWGEAIVAAVTFLVDPLNWLRLVEVVFGFVLILAGVAVLVQELGSKSATVRDAASLAIPAARAAKAAGALKTVGKAA